MFKIIAVFRHKGLFLEISATPPIHINKRIKTCNYFSYLSNLSAKWQHHLLSIFSCFKATMMIQLRSRFCWHLVQRKEASNQYPSLKVLKIVNLNGKKASNPIYWNPPAVIAHDLSMTITVVLGLLPIVHAFWKMPSSSSGSISYILTVSYTFLEPGFTRKGD